MKYCPACKTMKPKSDFGANKSRSDGLQGNCKACRQASYEANKEQRLADQKVYRDAHKEEINAKQKAYAEAHVEEQRRRASEWQEEHKEYRAEYIKKYNEEHKEEKVARDKEYSKKWRAENPENQRHWNSVRRSQVKLSPQDRAKSVAYRAKIANDPCYYCGEVKDVMVVDHYFPLSLGGTDHWYNLVRACWGCNGSKHNKLASEWEVSNGISRQPVKTRVRS